MKRATLLAFAFKVQPKLDLACLPLHPDLVVNVWLLEVDLQQAPADPPLVIAQVFRQQLWQAVVDEA